MAEEGEKIKILLIKYKYVILAVFGIVFIITGWILMVTTVNMVSEKEHIEDYTNCDRFAIDTPKQYSCFEYLEENPNSDNCKCLITFNITEPLQGEVTLYYKLPNFDQSTISNSRDNDQLRGVLSINPSVDCEPYRYDVDNRTIAPCGALADAKFSDIFSHFSMVDTNRTSAEEINLLAYGMLSAEDKIGFHNPDNLSDALQNFTKPKSWKKHIYELDENNAYNNGFENEQFISWMRTDWNRKHIARVDHNKTELKDGLPAALYRIRIVYAYPLDKYKGERKLIFVAKRNITVILNYGAGVTLLSIGLVVSAAGAILFAKEYLDKRNRAKVPEEGRNVTNATSPTLLNKEQNTSQGQNENRISTSAPSLDKQQNKPLVQNINRTST